MLHSVHIGTTHRPSDTRIFHKEARTLAEAGYRVSVLAPHAQTGEVWDGIRILGVAPPRDGYDRLTRVMWQLYRRARAFPLGTVLHVHDAEFLVYALRLKALGHTVVYDAHEDTPRQMRYQHWIPKLLRGPVGETLGVLERIGGRVFDHVIAAEPVIEARFPSGNTTLVRNFPLLSEFDTADATSYEERKPDVAYVGGLTRVRGLFEMLEVAEALPDDGALHLGGAFHPASLQAEAEQQHGWRRTRYHGYLRREDVAALLGRARVGLVVLHPTPKYRAAYPTKLFEYMAAGLPVVASDFPAWRPFVEKSRCGLLVDPMDGRAVREAVTWLLEHPDEAEAMGRRGREAVERHYAWEGEAERLLAVYRSLEDASA